MKEKLIKIWEEDKETYLQQNYIFEDCPKMDDKVKCGHCEKIIKVGDLKVVKDEDGFEFIMCPNYPDCDGTIIDWMKIDCESEKD